jgi:peptidoglycan L-alanyl-D-glutamate endopeptidase CwlK
MRDKISIARAGLLHPAVRAEVIQTIDEIEAGFPVTIKVRIVQGLRTIEEQNSLYAKGRTAPGPKVTNARGGSSYHNYGLAIDFTLIYNDKELSWSLVKDGDGDGRKDWDEVVNAFRAKGWGWGGTWRTFKDYPHLEKTFGYKTGDLLSRHRAGDFIPGTKYVKL